MTKLREMAREVQAWTEVPGDARYEICPEGIVRNKRTQRPLSPWVNSAGYPHVSLGTAKDKHNFSVHRLVATTFLPNPNGFEQVNHKDGDKRNSVLSNLEWCSRSQNMTHAWGTGLFRPRRPSGENSHQAKLNTSEVIAIIGMLKSGLSKAEIARHTGMSESAIRFIANGQTWKHIPR